MGVIPLYVPINNFASERSFGACILSLLAGYLFLNFAGRIGLGTKLPPQFGQTLSNIVLAQSLQNVHSKVQIIASEVVFGRSLLQCSQLALNSYIIE